MFLSITIKYIITIAFQQIQIKYMYYMYQHQIQTHIKSDIMEAFIPSVYFRVNKGFQYISFSKYLK